MGGEEEGTAEIPRQDQDPVPGLVDEIQRQRLRSHLLQLFPPGRVVLLSLHHRPQTRSGRRGCPGAGGTAGGGKSHSLTETDQNADI